MPAEAAGEAVNATAAAPPLPLPPHLEHAVHQALSDLQASRLLYPQRCAAAEQQGGSERQEAERWAAGGGWGAAGETGRLGRQAQLACR